MVLILVYFHVKMHVLITVGKCLMKQEIRPPFLEWSSLKRLKTAISLFKTNPSSFVLLIPITSAFGYYAGWQISSIFVEGILMLQLIKYNLLFLNMFHLLPLFEVCLSKLVWFSSPVNWKITVTKKEVIPHVIILYHCAWSRIFLLA